MCKLVMHLWRWFSNSRSGQGPNSFSFPKHNIMHWDWDGEKKMGTLKNVNFSAGFLLAISPFTAVVFVAGCQFGSIAKSNSKQWSPRKSLRCGDLVSHQEPAASSHQHWFYLRCWFYIIRDLIYCLLPVWHTASWAFTSSSYNPKPNLKQDQKDLYTNLQLKKLIGNRIIWRKCVKIVFNLPFLHCSMLYYISKAPSRATCWCMI